MSHVFVTSLLCKSYKPNSMWFAKLFMRRNTLLNITRNLIDEIEELENKIN